MRGVLRVLTTTAAACLSCAPAVTGTVRPEPAPEVAVPPAPRASDRVEQLLERMTLAEKIGQMTQITVQSVAAARHRGGGIVLDSAKLENAIAQRHVGSLLNVLDAAISVEGWQTLLTQIQDVATKRTRLGIPVLYGIDFVHGANYLAGGTAFPHNIALAATFDTALARLTGAVTGREALAASLHWNFAPVLDIGRQPLWPRFYETFGEDPQLASRMGAANLLGIQESGRVAATAKHYLGNGLPRSGRDRTPVGMGEREIREKVLPPFRAAVRAGVRTVMVSSGEINGEPVHASRYWLTDVLRGELGFDGVIVSDWGDIDALHTLHRVARSTREAARMALDAGIDVSMTPYRMDFIDTVAALVRSGEISENRIDESVRRILRLKFDLGLFEQPYPDPSRIATVGLAESRELARRAARESLTLLKNDGTLPLKTGARVLLAGPAANSVTALHGGWSYTWQGTNPSHYPDGTPTLLDAVRRRVADVAHFAGSSFTDLSEKEIADAVSAARVADVAIIALGEDAYAEWVGNVTDLTLPSSQLRLAQAIQATGTPTVLVLLQGRPRIIAPIANEARSILMAYLPGMEGAEAIAEVLFGESNPGGRLPFTYPRAPNELLTYDHRYTETLDVSFGRAAGGFNPQFEFGHGLSYTTFAFSDLDLDRASVGAGDTLIVRLTVTNTGSRAGHETILIFSRRHFASLTPAVRQLQAFARVFLAPGESRQVSLVVEPGQLAVTGRDGRPVWEPGTGEIMAGGLVRQLVFR